MSFRKPRKSAVEAAVDAIRRKAIEKRYPRVTVMQIGEEINYNGPTDDIRALHDELAKAGFLPADRGKDRSDMPLRYPEDVKVPFGKHKGKTLSEVLQDDARYLDWLRGTAILNYSFREALGEFCQKYEVEIDRALDD